jgi:hypothetical protein
VFPIEASGQSRLNPLRAALEARDLGPLRESLAEDAVLRSPIFSVPFEGRERLLELYEVLFEVFGEMSYGADVGGDPQIFVWSSEVDGEPIEGVDTFSYDAAGKIAEITVYMRPLRGIAAFLDKAGPLLGARRSRGRAILMKVMGPPPSMMMRTVAGLGPRLLGITKRPGRGDSSK